MSITAAQLTAQISVSGDDAARSKLQSVGNAVDETTQKMGGGGLLGGIKSAAGGFLDFAGKIGMGVMGFKAVADSAIGLGKALLEPNASMEQTTVGFETLLGKGKATQDFLNQLKNFAAVTPFEFPELATDAQHMLAFGFSAKEVIPTLTDIGDAMSAMGKGSADIDRVVAVFGQMKAAGKANAGDMMQLADQGIPAWKFLAAAMHKTIPEVQDLSSKGLIPAKTAIDAVTSGMHQMFGGGMAAQANTFNGLLSTLKDNAGAALRSFTGPLFDAAKSGLLVLGNLVSGKGFQDFATGAGKGVADVFGKIGAALREFFSNPQVKSIMDGIAQSFSQVSQNGPALKQVGDTLMGLGRAALNMSSLVNIIEGIARHGKDLGQWWQQSVIPAIKQAAPGFAALGQALAGLLPVFEQVAAVVHNQFQRIFDAMLPMMKQAVPIIIQVAGALAGGLGAAIKFLAPIIGQVVIALMTFIGDIVVRVMPIIQQLASSISSGMQPAIKVWMAIWPGLSQILQGVWQQIQGIIQIAWALITGMFKIALDVLSGNWGQAWTDMQDMLKGVWEGIKSYFTGAWNIIRGVVTAMVSGIKALFQGLDDDLVGHSIIPNMINGIISWFAQLPGRVGAWIQNMVSMVLGKINGLATQALTAGSNIVNNIADGIRNAIGNVGSAIGSVTQYIADHLPHSPAKIGPLRDLPLMGAKIAEQIGAGMRSGAPALSIGMNQMVSPVFASRFAGTSSAPAGAGQQIRLDINGQQFARLIMPYVVSQIRSGVNVHGI